MGESKEDVSNNVNILILIHAKEDGHEFLTPSIVAVAAAAASMVSVALVVPDLLAIIPISDINLEREGEESPHLHIKEMLC